MILFHLARIESTSLFGWNTCITYDYEKQFDVHV